MGFEPTTVGFGVQRSTVGATPSRLSITPQSLSKTTLGITRRPSPKYSQHPSPIISQTQPTSTLPNPINKPKHNYQQFMI